MFRMNPKVEKIPVVIDRAEKTRAKFVKDRNERVSWKVYPNLLTSSSASKRGHMLALSWRFRTRRSHLLSSHYQTIGWLRGIYNRAESGFKVPVPNRPQWVRPDFLAIPPRARAEPDRLARRLAGSRVSMYSR